MFHVHQLEGFVQNEFDYKKKITRFMNVIANNEQITLSTKQNNRCLPEFICGEWMLVHLIFLTID